MLSSRWLHVTGLAVTAPIVIVLCAIAVDQFLSGDHAVGWRSGGKLPPSATGSVDTYLIAVLAAVVWLGGLVKVVRMFRKSVPGSMGESG